MKELKSFGDRNAKGLSDCGGENLTTGWEV